MLTPEFANKIQQITDLLDDALAAVQEWTKDRWR